MSDCNCTRPPQTTCPYISGDPRIFKSPKSTCVMSNTSNFDERLHMVHNADKYIRQDRVDAFVKKRCEPCFAYEENGTEVPELSKLSCNGSFCAVATNDTNGLGQGRSNDGFRFQGFDPMYYPVEGKPAGNTFYASFDGFSSL